MDANCLEETFIETTYEAILEKIAKLPKEKANLRLGEKVMKVLMPEDRISGAIKLGTVKAEVLTFDEVVVTVPLGSMKIVAEASFSPRLPDRILSAFANISVGHLEKVCMPSILSSHLLT
jgi:hypothetical protein